MSEQPHNELDDWRNLAARYECTTPAELAEVLAGYRDAADGKLRDRLDGWIDMARQFHHITPSDLAGHIIFTEQSQQLAHAEASRLRARMATIRETLDLLLGERF